MKATIKNVQKRQYSAPEVECVTLDCDISLTLDSEPPIGPGWETYTSKDHFSNDPFKTNMG
jgi:hypothetical protein